MVSTDLPELKDWKVGSKYKIELDVRLVESEVEGEKDIKSEFEIIKAKAL
jgi:hypothetical protein